MNEEYLQLVASDVVNLNFHDVKESCKKASQAGVPAHGIVDWGLSKDMEIVGKKYESNEYFLSELIFAGELIKEAMKLLEPHLKATDLKRIGKVVIGTVEGDLHDIGKNVASLMLQTAGFEIVDLGVDVLPEKFVQAVKEEKPQILAMSALLTITMPEMQNSIRALEKEGIRNSVKVIIGGAPVTSEYAQRIGADAAAYEAVHGVSICKEWVQTR